MPEYTFVSIPFARRREGATPSRDYQEVIREQAAAGWEFVQAISFASAPDPHLDLVFTRKGASR